MQHVHTPEFWGAPLGTPTWCPILWPSWKESSAILHIQNPRRKWISPAQVWQDHVTFPSLIVAKHASPIFAYGQPLWRSSISQRWAGGPWGWPCLARNIRGSPWTCGVGGEAQSSRSKQFSSGEAGALNQLSPPMENSYRTAIQTQVLEIKPQKKWRAKVISFKCKKMNKTILSSELLVKYFNWGRKHNKQ